MVASTCYTSYSGTEIGWITILGQPREKVSESPISTTTKKNPKLGMVVSACHPSYTEGVGGKIEV
jgi:hypothetical protein